MGVMRDEGAFWSGIRDDILGFRNKGYTVIGVCDLNAKAGAIPDGAGARLGYKWHDRAGEALSALLVATGLLSMNGKLLWGGRQEKGLGKNGVCEGVRPCAFCWSLLAFDESIVCQGSKKLFAMHFKSGKVCSVFEMILYFDREHSDQCLVLYEGTW